MEHGGGKKKRKRKRKMLRKVGKSSRRAVKITVRARVDV